MDNKENQRIFVVILVVNRVVIGVFLFTQHFDFKGVYVVCS